MRRRDRALFHVHHHPPGTSKWNRIEHPLFCNITQNWRGRPLTDRLVGVDLIGATTTRTGLEVILPRKSGRGQAVMRSVSAGDR